MERPLIQEEDGIGWRCLNCGYFHRGDPSYEKAPESCEDCEIKFIGSEPRIDTPPEKLDH